MFESGLRTTPYANRVAQERLFLCLGSHRFVCNADYQRTTETFIYVADVHSSF